MTRFLFIFPTAVFSFAANESFFPPSSWVQHSNRYKYCGQSFLFFFLTRFSCKLRPFLMRSFFRERSLTTYLRDNRVDLWTKKGSGYCRSQMLAALSNSLSCSAQEKQCWVDSFIRSVINKFVSLRAMFNTRRQCRYRALSGIFACNMRTKQSIA